MASPAADGRPYRMSLHLLIQEYLAALEPKLQHVFKNREDVNDWVAMTDADETGEYLYWYNRLTGESSWENPAA